MKKWIIKWDAGYGDSYEIVEAETLEEAKKEAYQRWKDEAESNASYSAVEHTDELAEEYGL